MNTEKTENRRNNENGRKNRKKRAERKRRTGAQRTRVAGSRPGRARSAGPSPGGDPRPGRSAGAGGPARRSPAPPGVLSPSPIPAEPVPEPSPRPPALTHRPSAGEPHSARGGGTACPPLRSPGPGRRAGIEGPGSGGGRAGGLGRLGGSRRRGCAGGAGPVPRSRGAPAATWDQFDVGNTSISAVTVRGPPIGSRAAPKWPRRRGGVWGGGTTSFTGPRGASARVGLLAPSPRDTPLQSQTNPRSPWGRFRAAE